MPAARAGSLKQKDHITDDVLEAILEKLRLQFNPSVIIGLLSIELKGTLRQQRKITYRVYILHCLNAEKKICHVIHQLQAWHCKGIQSCLVSCWPIVFYQLHFQRVWHTTPSLPKVFTWFLYNQLKLVFHSFFIVSRLWIFDKTHTVVRRSLKIERKTVWETEILEMEDSRVQPRCDA